MSLSLYSSLMQPQQPIVSRSPPPPPPPPRSDSRDGSAADTDDLSSVEQRLLDFFPAASKPNTAAPAPAAVQPAQPAVVGAGSAKAVVPPTPKLLSALHSRTPSVSPFARMGLEYEEEEEEEQNTAAAHGRSRGRDDSVTRKDIDEESKEAEAGGASVRDVKQATAELVFATRQRRSTLREKKAHNRINSTLSSPAAAHKVEDTLAVAADIIPEGEQQPRGRRIISNARMMNAANRPALHTAMPLSPNSPLSPPPPPVPVSQPARSAADATSVAVAEDRAAPLKKKPTAFLSHLAGLVKTPMTASSPAIPRYHAAVEAVADAMQPASPTAATAAAAVEQSRAAIAAAQQAASRQQAATPASHSNPDLDGPAPTAPESGKTRLTAAASPTQGVSQASMGVEVPALAVVNSETEQPAAVVLLAEQPNDGERSPVREAHGASKDDGSWDDSEDDGSDADSLGAGSSHSDDSSHERVASASDSDSDAFMQSLSSMWSSAKRRQDKQLARQQAQVAERAQQQQKYGKTLLSGGAIVEREGGRMRKEVRWALRSGRGRDGAKLTLEQRKAMKMAAVYRQKEQRIAKPAQREEERRKQEDADNKRNVRPLTPQPAGRALAVPIPATSHSSPSSPRRRTAPGLTAPNQPAPFIPVRYDAPDMPAEPLPARPSTEVVFGRSTAVSEEEAARRSKKNQRRGPSLFDLAYGTAAAKAGDANSEPRVNKAARSVADEEDTEVAHPPAVPVVIPARVLRAPPPVSGHVISEGIAAGLPFSIRAIKRRTTESAAVVPAESDLAAIAQQAIRQHKRDTPPQPSSALNASTLSPKGVSFPRTPRTPQPAKASPATAAAAQRPAKRPRMAAKTAAHLERLHSAHMEAQQKLQRERREKEERALEGCTFAPQLAAKSEKLAERKRMQDEVQMRLYDMIRGRKTADKLKKRDDEQAEEDDVPITWGWEDADQPAPATAAAAAASIAVDTHSSAVHTMSPTPVSSSAGKREKLSRAEVMHAQHRIQQERLREQKQLEDEQKAQQQLAQCTFAPHTNHYAAPSASTSAASSSSAVSSTQAQPEVSASIADEQPTHRTAVVPPPMVVQRMHASYEEQFVRETSRRQSHESNQQRVEQPDGLTPSTQLAAAPGKPEADDVEDEDLFTTGEAATARSAAPRATPPAAQQLTQHKHEANAEHNVQADAPASAVAAWLIPDDGEYEDVHATSASHAVDASGSAAIDHNHTVSEGGRDALHTSFAWAVPSFSTDTGDDELDSPVLSYPEVVHAHERRDAAAGDTDDELDELTNTTELAHFRSTLLAAQMSKAPVDTSGPHDVLSAYHPAPDGSSEPAQHEELPAEQSSITSSASAVSHAGGDAKALLYVDIALSASRVERMQLCDGDDLLRCASEFCAKHGLHADYVSIIEGMLHQQLQPAS